MQGVPERPGDPAGEVSGRVVVLVVEDLMARSRLEAAALAAGWMPKFAHRLDPEIGPVELVVLDLDRPSVMDEIRAWRATHPAIDVVGFVSHVDGGTRKAAESLGIRVVPRGATAGDASRIFSHR